MSDPAPDEPWVASDGTCWLHFPEFGEWTGWQPGEDGLWVMAEAEFAHLYPEYRAQRIRRENEQ